VISSSHYPFDSGPIVGGHTATRATPSNHLTIGCVQAMPQKMFVVMALTALAVS
jgi:hypothetical protein